MVLSMAGIQAVTAERFAVYYNSDNSPALMSYDTLVLDSDSYPPLAPLTKAGKTVLGYISLGEVENTRSWYKQVSAMGILLGPNPNWPGSRYVDVRDPRWQQLVVTQLIPGIMAKGFTGVFLDTLDDPAYLEETNPKLYAGMTNASVALVKAIRAAYPSLPIMMNRGFEILPAVGGSINMELAESLISDYNFAKKTYHYVAARDVASTLKVLGAAKLAHPALKLYSLDYWNPKDAATIRSIYATEQRNGFIPYVSTVDLSRLVPGH